MAQNLETLETFLSKAKDFLYPYKPPECQAKEREKLIAFCKERGFDEEFLGLKEKNQKWCDLLKEHEVGYLVERPEEYPIEAPLPSINLLILDSGTSAPVPVIKITVTEGFFLDNRIDS